MHAGSSLVVAMGVVVVVRVIMGRGRLSGARRDDRRLFVVLAWVFCPMVSRLPSFLRPPPFWLATLFSFGHPWGGSRFFRSATFFLVRHLFVAATFFCGRHLFLVRHPWWPPPFLVAATFFGGGHQGWRTKKRWRPQKKVAATKRWRNEKKGGGTKKT